MASYEGVQLSQRVRLVKKTVFMNFNSQADRQVNQNQKQPVQGWRQPRRGSRVAKPPLVVDLRQLPQTGIIGSGKSPSRGKGGADPFQDKYKGAT
ncbi:MAG: hypothetical protein EZS28_000917 [Streblomastix strix]|uniref:Uncharacterized protein n=1 Tax=Streblomastix strix TaxID=222440 RepID=A0A5J4X8I2_9EUKA|nr:MAG: hypothetical protein EZS28_000917 [Streblomastix strix]